MKFPALGDNLFGKIANSYRENASCEEVVRGALQFRGIGIFCISVRTFWPKLQISTRRIEAWRRWHAGISRSRNFCTPRQTFLAEVAIVVISFLPKVTQTSIEMKFSKTVSSSQLHQARLFHETIIFPVVGSSSPRYPRTGIERNKGRAKQSNAESKFSIEMLIDQRASRSIVDSGTRIGELRTIGRVIKASCKLALITRAHDRAIPLNARPAV